MGLLGAVLASAGPPPEIAVPDGSHLALAARVVAGVQSYECASDQHYHLIGPTALLRTHDGGFIVHALGPSWQYQDGSTIIGEVVAHAPQARAVDVLLLHVVQHTGKSGRFSEVTYVQRLGTGGGVAPAHCNPAQDAVLAVPYSAEYRFFTGP